MLIASFVSYIYVKIKTNRRFAMWIIPFSMTYEKIANRKNHRAIVLGFNSNVLGTNFIMIFAQQNLDFHKSKLNNFE